MKIKTTTVINTLIGVIASSNRRKTKYLQQQALVSHLYPYYFKDTLVVNNPEVIDIGEPFMPYDFFSIDTPTVSSIVLSSPIIERDYPDLDVFGIETPIVESIVINEVVVRRNYPPLDEFGVDTPEVVAMTINTVAIRVDYPSDDEFAVDTPTVKSIVLETV